MRRRKEKVLLTLLLAAVMVISATISSFACGSSYYYNPCGGSHYYNPCIAKAKYTVYYREYGSNVQLAAPKTKEVYNKTTVTETAIDIAGYTVYGDSKKSLTVKSGYCNSITFYYIKKVKTASYNVKYLEYGTNKELAKGKTVDNQNIGSTVTETAIDIEGYTVYGDSKKSLVIKCGSCNTIIFYYKKAPVCLTDYTVKYLENGTEKELAPEKPVKDQVVGSTVTETAIDIKGYHVVGEDTKSLVLKACKNTQTGSSQTESGSATVTGPVTRDQAVEIAMTHSGLSKSRIREIDVEKKYRNGKCIYEVEIECYHGYEFEYKIERETGIILNYEWEHGGCSKCGSAGTSTQKTTCTTTWCYYRPSCPTKPTCPSKPTYPDKPRCSDETEEACNVIIFYYEEDEAVKYADYTVKYLEKDTNTPVADEKTVTDVEIGTEVSEDAITVEGYDALDPTSATIEIVEGSNEIIFWYEKSVVLTEYTVKYLNQETNRPLANSKTVTDVPVGSSVTEQAIEIEEYTAQDPTEVTLVLTESGNEIIFWYKSTGSEA